jgi:hypothetical protein
MENMCYLYIPNIMKHNTFLIVVSDGVDNEHYINHYLGFKELLESRGNWKEVDKNYKGHIDYALTAYELKLLSGINSVIKLGMGHDKGYNILTHKIHFINSIRSFHKDIAKKILLRSYVINKNNKGNIPDNIFDGKSPWIIKPSASYAGIGQEIIVNKDQLDSYLSKDVAIHNDFIVTKFLLEKYMDKPLLLNKRKFHIRSFLIYIIDKDNKRRAYMLKKMNVVLAKNEFIQDDWNNKDIHDTHFDGTNHKIFPDEIRDDMVPDVMESITDQVIKINKVLVNILDKTTFKYEENDVNYRFIGIDYMVTNDNKVKILEANKNPGFPHDKSDFLTYMIKSILETVVDPHFAPLNDIDSVKEHLISISPPTMSRMNNKHAFHIYNKHKDIEEDKKNNPNNDFPILRKKLIERGNWYECDNYKMDTLDFVMINSANKEVYEIISFIKSGFGQGKGRKILSHKVHYVQTVKDFCPKLYKIMLQESYIIDKHKRKNIPDVLDDNTKWIIKPTAGFLGIGQEIISTKSELDIYLNKNITIHGGPSVNLFLMEKYILSPMLYKGRKTGMRTTVIYIIDSKSNKRKAYMLNKMILLYSNNKYSDTKFDKSIHDVHFYNSTQCIFPDYVDRDVISTNTINLITKQIKIMLKCLVNMLDKTTYGYKESSVNFQIIGVDFIVTDTYNVKMLEPNSNPGYGKDNEEYYNYLFDAIIETVVDPYYPPSHKPKSVMNDITDLTKYEIKDDDIQELLKL